MPYSVLEGSAAREPFYLYQPFSREEWERYPFASEEDLQWFRDAKLGLFLHVGLSALGKVDIGWSRHTHKPPDGGIGPVPDEVYDHWAEEIALPDFDARKWIQLARDGGMKYVVIITKHHDGFHMWDTAYSDYKITNSPFGRDYLRELVDACHEAGMKVGLYYSQRDWKHPDYEPIPPEVSEKAPPHTLFQYQEGQPVRITERHRRYIAYMHNTVRELMTNYGEIDILWWDACWWGRMFLEEMWDADQIEREARALQPHLLINNRASLPGDFDTPEGSVGFFQNTRPWETCMPLGPAWAWTGEEIKSFRTVLHQFINCVCGDGNYLLSIGAMPNGEFDRPEQERVRQLGDWLSRYGESVYKTRGGPWLPGAWGGATFRGRTVYLHLLQAEPGGTLALPAISAKILRAECLTGEKVTVSQDESGVRAALDAGQVPGDDVIIRLEMDSVPEVLSQDRAQNLFAASPAVYGELILDTETGLPASFPLKADRLLTGIAAEPEEGIVCRIEALSLSGEWETIGDDIREPAEIPVLRYEAGAYITGRRCRELRIAGSGSGCVKLKLYAKASE